VRLLEKHIERARKNGQRAEALNQAVGEQAKEIQTLKYQMQKLEEIQLETDRKRQSLELEGE
jgi:DNA repair ATPase RecN